MARHLQGFLLSLQSASKKSGWSVTVNVRIHGAFPESRTIPATTMKKNILAVYGAASLPASVIAQLETRFTIQSVPSGARALELVKVERVDALLVALDLPDMPGLNVIKSVKQEIDRSLPVIAVTDHDDRPDVHEAVWYGAFDVIPFRQSAESLSMKITRALEHREMELHVGLLRATLNDARSPFIAASEKMKNVLKEVVRIAPHANDILIQGEAGTGKDRMALELHARGPRADRPFIPISLRSLAERTAETELFGQERGAYPGAGALRVGRIESAQGGTIYIPEVAFLPRSVQERLLRVMVDRTFSRNGHDPRKPELPADIRFIMATGEDLKDLVRRGKMLEEFQERISSVAISLPPLRQRKGDIVPLALHFFRLYAQPEQSSRLEIPEDVRQQLESYPWPGNVRELECAVRNASVFLNGPVVSRDLFPTKNAPARLADTDPLPSVDDMASFNYHQADVLFKKRYFQDLLRSTNGNISKAAIKAGITRQGLHKILNGLKGEGYDLTGRRPANQHADAETV